MEYNVILNAHSYKLVPYSVEIEDEIDRHKSIKKAVSKVEFRNEMYGFLVSVLGEETVNEIVGLPLAYDPNTLKITYDKVIDAYGKKYSDYKAGEVARVVRESRDILDLAKLMPTLANLDD